MPKCLRWHKVASQITITLSSDHFMIYVYQINMVYTLNLYDFISQLYLNNFFLKKEITLKLSSTFNLFIYLLNKYLFGAPLMFRRLG